MSFTGADLFFAVTCKNQKKEEFPGLMENMIPGNSFPQICVVSVNECVGNGHLTQRHGRAETLSNLASNGSVNKLREVVIIALGAVRIGSSMQCQRTVHGAHGELDADRKSVV